MRDPKKVSFLIYSKSGKNIKRGGKIQRKIQYRFRHSRNYAI